MAKGLKRYYGQEYLHFLTCSCYHRQSWLATARRRDLFLQILEEVRQRYRFVVVGYVVMPDHIHLLTSEPERATHGPTKSEKCFPPLSTRHQPEIRKSRPALVPHVQEVFVAGSSNTAVAFMNGTI